MDGNNQKDDDAETAGKTGGNYGVPLFGMPLQSNQSYGVPLFGMPLQSNAAPPPQSNATPSAPPKQSNATSPPIKGEPQRDRTSTEESVSKETLVKLMKEQVDLVNRLTDQQKAQQVELDRIKEEKRMMEEQTKLKHEEEEDHKLVDMVNQLTKEQIAQKEELERLKEEKRLIEEQVKLKQEEDQAKALQQKLEKLMSQNNKMSPIVENTATPAPPAARPRLGTSDSNKSVVSMFKRPPDNRYIPMNVPESQQKVRRHPDAIYFNRGSTAAFPTAVNTVVNNQKRNRNGPQRGPSIPVITGPGAVTGYSKDRIEITHIPERNVVNEKESSCADSCWWAFSRLCTILIPSFALFWVGRDVKVTKGMSREAKDEAIKLQKEAKQAWREKVTIFLIQMVFCCGFFGVSAVIPMYVCRDTTPGGKSLIPDIYCETFSIVMYGVMILITGVLAIQCLCSIIYIVRRKRTIKRDDTRSKMIIMVPCYNEGDKELRKTIDSVMDTSYPDDNKVLLVIADGNITGKGERMSTPETLAKLLGYKMDSKEEKIYNCKSIGELTENRAKIQYGIYKDAGKELKYIVIVKCGMPSEAGSPRAGNRGKRDSQLLFSGLLNRFHHGRALNDLDKAIKNALDRLQLPLDEIRFLMAIDADTRIDHESLSHMTFSMNKNDRILALCGETKVDNKAQSWVTMIQVFEYYTNHHMKKAFESVFGCVTCLPGCFTMYRLFSDDGRPLLSCDDVYQRYATNNVRTLHDKNLYHLGEDRMLTTLLLTYFPDMKLSFVPEAFCYTIVPHTFSILLSQRRRWINSTFHNMLELVRVNTMCGCCCFSMKAIVILDLIATLILPASLLYVGYIVYITVFLDQPLSLLIIIMWGIVIGVQVVVFLLRSRWDYWWWFLVFVFAGVPVFYFILPLYSFWHMDDFSWGTTRQLSAAPTPAAKAATSGNTAVAHQPNQLSPSGRSSGPVDVDRVSDVAYDPAKYMNAEEAKQARAQRRAAC